MVTAKYLLPLAVLGSIGCSTTATEVPPAQATSAQAAPAQATRDERPDGWLDYAEQDLERYASQLEAEALSEALAQNRIWATRYLPERQYSNGVTTATGATYDRMHRQAIERSAQMLTTFGWGPDTVTDEDHAKRLVEATVKLFDPDSLPHLITLARYVVVADLLAVVPTNPENQFQSMVAQYRVVESIKGGVPVGDLFQMPQPTTSEMAMPGASGRYLMFLYVPKGSPSWWTKEIIEGSQPPPPPGGVTWARSAFGRMPVQPDGTLSPSYHGPEVDASLDYVRRLAIR